MLLVKGVLSDLRGIYNKSNAILFSRAHIHTAHKHSHILGIAAPIYSH